MVKVAQHWTEHEFAGLDPGDARLDRRAKKLMERLAESPAASIPEACDSWSETMAAYRFLRNEDEQALSAKQQDSGQLKNCRKVVACLPQCRRNGFVAISQALADYASASYKQGLPGSTNEYQFRIG